MLTAAGPATIQSGGQVSANQPNLKTTFDVPVIFKGGNSARWTLQDDMEVSKSVTFINGIVVAKPLAPNEDIRPGANGGNNNAPAGPKFVFTASPVVNGGSDNSHVDGYIHLRNAGNATRDVELPIGDGIQRRVLALTKVSNGSGNEFIIRYFRNRAPISINPAMPTAIAPRNNLTSVGDKEYWYVSSENGSASYRFKVSYNLPGLPDYYRPDVPQGLTVVRLNTANEWANAGGTVNTSTGTIQIEGQATGYKWYTIGRTDNIDLPIHLVSFSASQLDGRVGLKWQSAAEENTSHFEVERSADGQHFALVLTKKAQGNSTALVSYSAVDDSPLGGISYYRLKIVDLDGTFTYSNLVSVRSEGNVRVRAYPNPSNGREVQFLALNGDKLVLQSVMDAFGRPVGYEASRVYGQGLYVNFYGALPAGLYVATLVSDDDKRERVRIKFIVQ
jgi:hypothetical protein